MSDWHRRDIADVLRTLRTDWESGLSSTGAADRLREEGPNELPGGPALCFVEELYRLLARDGVDCFFDKKSIKWGQNWVIALDDALERCGFIVIVISDDFVQSEWVKREWSSALEKIHPLLLKPCQIPRLISSIQHIDVSTPQKFEQNYPEIYKSLGGRYLPPSLQADRTQQVFSIGMLQDFITWFTLDGLIRALVVGTLVAALYNRSLHLTAADYPWLAIGHQGTLAAVDPSALKAALQQQGDFSCRSCTTAAANRQSGRHRTARRDRGRLAARLQIRKRSGCSGVLRPGRLPAAGSRRRSGK